VLFDEKPAIDELAHLESKLTGAFDAGRFPEGRGYLASMGIYVFRKELLIKILAATCKHDFGADIIPDVISQYRVMSYPFSGYWADIGTIRSFYEANLDLTETLPQFNFYQESS